jgi:hypothetical protein
MYVEPGPPRAIVREVKREIKVVTLIALPASFLNREVIEVRFGRLPTSKWKRNEVKLVVRWPERKHDRTLRVKMMWWWFGNRTELAKREAKTGLVANWFRWMHEHSHYP